MALGKSAMLFLWMVVSGLLFYDLNITISASKPINKLNEVKISYATQKWCDLIVNYKKYCSIGQMRTKMVFPHLFQHPFYWILEHYKRHTSAKAAKTSKVFNAQKLAKKKNAFMQYWSISACSSL